MKQKKPPEILTTVDIARMAGVTTAAVLVWIHRTHNPLPTVKPYRSKGHRFRKDKAQAWLREYYRRGKRPARAGA
jgi:hypothetical protein